MPKMNRMRLGLPKPSMRGRVENWGDDGKGRKGGGWDPQTERERYGTHKLSWERFVDWGEQQKRRRRGREKVKLEWKKGSSMGDHPYRPELTPWCEFLGWGVRGQIRTEGILPCVPARWGSPQPSASAAAEGMRKNGKRRGRGGGGAGRGGA